MSPDNIFRLWFASRNELVKVTLDRQIHILSDTEEI